MHRKKPSLSGGGYIRSIKMGYIGYSMSENAYYAYESGERPLSKWSKSEIVAKLPSQWRGELKKLSVKDLKRIFLEKTSWHHTSKFYNRTDFYSFIDCCNDDINERIVKAIIDDCNWDKDYLSKRANGYKSTVEEYLKHCEIFNKDIVDYYYKSL